MSRSFTNLLRAMVPCWFIMLLSSAAGATNGPPHTSTRGLPAPNTSGLVVSTTTLSSAGQSAPTRSPSTSPRSVPRRLGSAPGREAWRRFASSWRNFDEPSTRQQYSPAIKATVDKAKVAASKGKGYDAVEAILINGLRTARADVGAGEGTYGQRGDSPYTHYSLVPRMLQSNGGTVSNDIVRWATSAEASKPERTIKLADGTSLRAVTLQHESPRGIAFLYPGRGFADVHEVAAKLYAKAVDRATPQPEAYEAALEMGYVLLNTLPYKQGSSSMGEMFLRTVLETRGIPTGVVKRGYGLDLIAWTRTLEQWKSEFPSYFEGGPRPHE